MFPADNYLWLADHFAAVAAQYRIGDPSRWWYLERAEGCRQTAEDLRREALCESR